MVELDLLQRGQRAVAFLRDREPALLELTGRIETIIPGPWLSQEGKRDDEDTRDRERGADDEGRSHASANAPAYRSASRRSSRASGHRAINDPATNTKPASQMRFTSGFCRIFRSTLPFVLT